MQLFLREAMPLLEARGVPVLLPGAWLGSPSRLRVNLTATSSGVAVRSSGLLSTAALATFDWRLSVGDVVLSEQELADLAAAIPSSVVCTLSSSVAPQKACQEPPSCSRYG